MRFQSLIVNGFKSFPEAKIVFPRGITAVVGPNGTGKSNIVDAMLWALGEQSPKTLRSERMEDVIFNGTELRKPIGLAEVSLVLEEVTAQELEAVSALGEDLGSSTQVMITRRLYRDGESEYYLNKIPCRLKDIRSLIWSARAGIKGHTVIEQGNIDQLLNASAQERREFIEETAGIIKYKKQRAEAIRKLDSTENNLSRVRDILSEVRRQLRSLERQAKQAQEYQELQGEVRALEIRLLCWDFRALAATHRQIQQELEECEAREIGLLGEETRLMTVQEEAKLSLASTTDLVNQTREELRKTDLSMSQTLTAIEVERSRISQFEQQHEQMMHERTRLNDEAQEVASAIESTTALLTRLRGEIGEVAGSVTELDVHVQECDSRKTLITEQLNRCRQDIMAATLQKTQMENRLKGVEEARRGLAKRVERLSAELEEYQGRRGRLLEEQEELRRRRESGEAAVQSQRTKREDLERSLRTHTDRLQEVDACLREEQTRLAGLESECHALRTILHEEFGLNSAGTAEESSIRGACQDIIQGALAEHMEVPEQIERAIEAALGDRLKAWVVERASDAVRAIEVLKERSLGRGIFLPLRTPGVKVETPHAWWAALQQESAVWGPALGFLHIPQELQSAAEVMLDGVIVVENLGAALDIMDRHAWFHGSGPLLVTLEGETVHPHGVVTGGLSGQTGGILRRRREILKLEERIGELSTAIQERQHKREELAREIQWLQNQLQDVDTDLRAAEVQSLEWQKDGDLREHALSELERRLETICNDLATEEAEDTRLQQEAREVGANVGELEGQVVEHEQALRQSMEALERVEQEFTAAQNHVTETRLRLSGLEARWTHEQGNLTRWEEEKREGLIRLQELDQQLERLFSQTKSSQEERHRNERRFEELEEKRRTEESHLANLEQEYTQGLERTKELEGQLIRVREALAEHLKARTAIEVRLAEVRTKQQTVRSTLVETYEINLESLTEEEQPESRVESSDDHREGEDHPEEPEGPEQWRDRLEASRKKIERMGPINLAAIQEHRELEERYQFLTSQEQDLTESMRSLQEIIQRLNQTTNELFSETFRILQEKFNEVFTALFAGGKAELLLVEPEDPEGEEGQRSREPGVEIVAQPPGKRLKNLTMLSGGEKTLTVLALLFASFLIKPSPFCVLDEVDAPLDEANVARFSQFMKQMAERSQFIVITHNKRTMEVADSLFGVTMEEPGISKLVSVRLNDVQTVG